MPQREPAPEPASDSVIIAGLMKRHKTGLLTTMVLLAVVAAGLTTAWFLSHRAAQPPAELTQQRLTFNSSENPVTSCAISPDSNYLAYSDAAGIHVKLLLTGEERLIPKPAGVPASADWHVASWFPAGAQLLANTSVPGGSTSTWTVSVLAQSAHELREAASGYEVSPDGVHIAFQPQGAPGAIQEIWVMGSRGDNPQKVLALGEGEEFYTVHWSPDGQRLAFIREVQTYRGPYHGASIETCDLTGAKRAVVVSEPDQDVSLEDFCWLPEGRIVYSRTEPSDSSTSNLWQIGIDSRSGTATGQAQRLTRWAGFRIGSMSDTADGKRLVFLKASSHGQLYLGELAAGGTRMNPPRRLTNDEANYFVDAWMPDSKTILFTSDRNGVFGIFKQAIDQETAEPLVSVTQTARYIGELPTLSPDGAWILYHEIPRQPSSERQLMRLPINGGAPQFVMAFRVAGAVGGGYRCARRPGGLCVILEASQDQKQATITAFDPLQGRGKVLRTIDKDATADYLDSRLSPDGATYAIPENGEGDSRIHLLSLAAGADHELTLKGWRGLSGIAWSPDGKGFYCGSHSAQINTLFYVDLSGNARVLWQVKGSGGPEWGIPSPDGRYLAIDSQVANSNAWMLEGF